mmetsp:Transcript_13534/g.17115  ORF Transcript_13534/g.17115 Transcript_13534/m.17115 type:complete len:138 (+) Transcript_13534:88-501(+)
MRPIAFRIILLLYLSSCLAVNSSAHLRSGSKETAKSRDQIHIREWQPTERELEDGNYNNDGDADDYLDDFYERSKQYVVSHANQGYHSQPYEWTMDEWVIFGLFMFLFGTSFCLMCSFCLIPCCCPSASRGYVRMLR